MALVVKIEPRRSLLDEVLEGRREFPLTMEEFRTFLELEHNEESLHFYQKAQAFERSPNEKLLKDIVNEFILVGSPHEINISDKERAKILQVFDECIKGSKDCSSAAHVFSNAMEEVKKLMQDGPFHRFINFVSQRNMPEDIVQFRERRGKTVLLLGLALAVAILCLQAFAVPQLKEESLQELLGSRWWRLVCTPFFFPGFLYYLTGREKVCPCLLTPQIIRNYFYSTGKAFEIKEEVIKQRFIRHAIRVLVKGVVGGLVMLAVIVFLPPGDDIYDF